MKNKQSSVMWNHLQYADQVKAMNKITELIKSQTDPIVKTALIAALSELEIWSNATCEDVDFQFSGDLAKKTWIH